MTCKLCNIEHNRNSSFCSNKCRNAHWYQQNKEHKRRYYINNIEQIIEKDKRWCADNKDRRKSTQKQYYEKNRQQIIEHKKTYRKQNRDKINKYQAEYYSNTKNRLRKNLRGRISCAIKRNFDGSRGGSFVRDLGCSMSFFKSFIESKWSTGMSWDNYGWGVDKWHLDHIVPLANFDLTNKEEFKKAAHYTNYQPLWQLDNFKKGAK